MESPLFSLYVWGLRLCIQVLNLWEVRIIILCFLQLFYQAQQTTLFWVPLSAGRTNHGKSESVSHSVLSLCNPTNCSPPGSSVLGILQARILEWVAVSFSRNSSWRRDRTQVSCVAGRFFHQLSYKGSLCLGVPFPGSSARNPLTMLFILLIQVSIKRLGVQPLPRNIKMQY